MGVYTSADEKRDEAKEHIEQAYKCLLNILDTDIWGSEQYNNEYIETLVKSVTKLRKINRKL